MTPVPKSFDPRVLARLGGLRLRARAVVEGLLAGLHRGRYRGFSIEFAEHREYAPGDDLRYLDWKAFARTDKLYLKQFEDETNLTCQLVIDISESMSYRGAQAALTKYEYAQCLAASLAWLVLRQRDSIGLVTFDEAMVDRVGPSSQASHFDRLLATLGAAEPTGPSRVGRVLEQLARSLDRRGVLIVISDFFDDVTHILAGLRELRLARHDVLVVQVLDRDEADFPFQSPAEFRGMEGMPDQFADPRGIAGDYVREFERFQLALRRGCHEFGIDHWTAHTDQPLDRVLIPLLRR